MKFKIDFSNSYLRPFGLFIWRPAMFRGRWDNIDSFETREQAIAFHEKIKDLPEYL